MYNISNFLKRIFKKKNRRKSLLDESDLEVLKMNEDYGDQRKMKIVAFWFLVVFLIFMFSVFVYAVITDTAVRATVVSLITNNISGILFYVLSILGANHLGKISRENSKE